MYHRGLFLHPWYNLYGFFGYPYPKISIVIDNNDNDKNSNNNNNRCRAFQFLSACFEMLKVGFSDFDIYDGRYI